MDDLSHAVNGDGHALLQQVPDDGSTISNRALREKLGWASEIDEDRFFAARNAVEDAGLIRRGRGRGGTVSLISTELQEDLAPGSAPVEASETVADTLRRELDLYEPLRGVIRTEWAKDHRVEPLAVENTALQGRRQTGIWSRPDLVSLEVRTFAYVPGKYIDVVTFEVKPAGALNVQAVYEALAHRRAATHSWVLAHVPDDRRQELQAVIQELAEVARAHGIGFTTFGDPRDYETWEEHEAAERVATDPERLDAFIGQQLDPATREKISRALR